MSLWLKIVCAISLGMSLVPALAQANNGSRAILADTIPSAFECPCFAATFKNTVEAERLLDGGYYAVTKVGNTLSDGEISEKDLSSIVRIGGGLLWAGQNLDLAIGRVYQSIAEESADNLVEMGPLAFGDDELQQSVTRTKFVDSNCALVGRAS